MKFKVGDEVVILNMLTDYLPLNHTGQRGVVEAVEYDEQIPYYVRLANFAHWFREQDLISADKLKRHERRNPANPPTHIGDPSSVLWQTTVLPVGWTDFYSSSPLEALAALADEWHPFPLHRVTNAAFVAALAEHRKIHCI